ncbi:MAG: hypothetical protein PHU85_19630, partial [Phycisphaerae bacterium]|nr:hypothetical protein [Phycisphaerae bacterium]
MSVSFQCRCGRSLEVDDELAGQQVSCPVCNEVLTVPTAAARSASAAVAGAPRDAAGRAWAAAFEPDQVYYRHSGHFSIAGLLLGFLGGVGVGVPLAVLYGVISFYDPIIYINLLLTLGFGLAVAWTAAKVMKFAKVRNTVLACTVALAAMLVAYYVSWVSWVWAVMQSAKQPVPFFSLLVSPRVMWFLIQAINEVGAWSIGHSESTVSGLALWGVWLGEAVYLLGASVYGAKRALSQPFCEVCQSWCAKSSLKFKARTCPADTVRPRLEARDFSILTELGQSPAGAYYWLEGDVYSCPRCGQLHTLTVTSVSVTPGKSAKDTKVK